MSSNNGLPSCGYRQFRAGKPALWTTGWVVDSLSVGRRNCRCLAVALFEGAGGQRGLRHYLYELAYLQGVEERLRVGHGEADAAV